VLRARRGRLRQALLTGCLDFLAAARPDGEQGVLVLSAQARRAPDNPPELSEDAAPQPTRRRSLMTRRRRSAFPHSRSRSDLLKSVEATHASHGTAMRVTVMLGITGVPARMGSGTKYGALGARGDGGKHVRLPTGGGYVDKIWVRARLALCAADTHIWCICRRFLG
jgi:hypothetical protein